MAGNSTLAVADDLSYNYFNHSNRLKAVTDANSHTNTVIDEFFTELSTGSTDYTYDPLGNMTADANKAISVIAYSHNNLATSLNNSDYIYYANGKKTENDRKRYFI